MKRLVLLLIAVLAAPLSAAPFTVQATGQGYAQLSDAVNAIGEGEGTILIAPGVYRQCAVQNAGRITYRAIQPRTAIFEVMTCEAKAALVVRGRGATVDGLVFRNFFVPDGNGSGIRLERGTLDVTNSVFRDSEQGILSGRDDPQAEVRIDRSTFSGLGRCDRGLSCAHSVYFGLIKSVTVRHSRFERGAGGHYVKSRAAEIEVSDCSFDDSHGHTTNYMIDLPAGATGIIERNIFVQGADKENHSAFIAVAAESRTNSSSGLVVLDNKAHQVDAATWPSALVANWSEDQIIVERNEVGPRVIASRGAEQQHAPSLSDKIIEKLRDRAIKAKQKLIG